MKTTFWNDFSIADAFGEDAILDTYRRSFAEWRDNVGYLSELVIVLNHKIWYWYKRDADHPYAVLYDGLWRRTHDWALDNLKGEDLRNYLRTVD